MVELDNYLEFASLRFAQLRNAATLAIGHAVLAIDEPGKVVIIIAAITPLLAFNLLGATTPQALGHAPQHQHTRRAVVPQPTNNAVPAGLAMGIARRRQRA
ncbi:hypothetical protein Dimus_035062 [Dionaea muscipula]